MALIGFARVSTLEQDLAVQIKSLTEYGCTKIFTAKIQVRRKQKTATRTFKLRA